MEINPQFVDRCAAQIHLMYTPLAELIARQARPGTTQDGSGNKAKNYSSISAINQHQLKQKMYQ